MKIQSSFIKTKLAACVALAFSVGLAHATESRSYAETIYDEYAASSGGTVSFKVAELQSGPLAKIKGFEFVALIGSPTQVLRASDNGFYTSEHTLEKTDSQSAEFADLFARPEDMAKVGYPVENGQFRLLQVAMMVGHEVSDHKALELCWGAQNYCHLLDPSVEFIDSIANNRIQLRAEGIGPVIEHEESNSLEKSRCGLASNPSWVGKTTTYPARNLKYRNVFKNVLVNKDLGGQQSGIRCDSSCKAQPFGYSNPSSAQGYLGWRTACDHNFHSGRNSTQTTAKYIGITGCSHRYAAAAKFIVTKKGVGTGVDLNIDVAGSEDRNGGFVFDTCGRF